MLRNEEKMLVRAILIKGCIESMPYYLAEIRFNKTSRNARRERKMGKRLIKHLVITLLVCVLIFTPIMIVSVAVGSDGSDQSEVITDLENLCKNISELPDEAFDKTGPVKGQRKALCNKIRAVINQIEAGASESAVNKLRNDIENAIMNWINDPWKSLLVEEVEDIIEKILDTEPPVIVEVWIEPETPAYNETVSVLANVTDEGSGVETVILSYSNDTGKWVNVKMDLVEELYVGEIPAFPYDTTVFYKICACDKAGNPATAGPYLYTVIDPYPPTISYVDHSPESPNYNQSVSVFAEVDEHPNASGVELVILSYRNGSDWTNVTMTLENTLYTATIPALPYGTTVQYKIFARDFAGNWAGSDVYSYEVTDKYAPIARIYSPPQGSYVASEVSVIVYVYDDNFDRAELTIDGMFMPPWMETGQHTFDWNTTTGPDGVYTIDLIAYDMDGNVAKTKITVTVDNTPPLVVINAPADGSYVKGTVLVSVTGNDANFDRTELYIDDIQVRSWTDWGSQDYGWNTTDYPDGPHTITLKVYDIAGNFNETAVTATVDNTVPTALITAPADESLLRGTVQVSVTGDDANFRNMELYIGGSLVVTFDESGTNNYRWDTSTYADGFYKITLKVHDKADNLATAEITVTIDNTLPLAEIRKPAEDAFLRGSSDIVVYGYDANIEQIELYIDGDLVETWTVSDVQTRTWDTTTFTDGSHTIKVAVSDKAGNVGEETVRVTTDNELPSAAVNAPADGSYVKGTATVSVTGDDASFDRMELYIDDDLTQTWTTSGSHSYGWDTTDYPDGSHTIELKVFDEVENTVEKTVAVNVDNTPPSIGTPSWLPEEPYADKQVNVSSLVSDPAPGSGLKSVILRYKNNADGEWQSIEMVEISSGNWTATIPGQSAGENVTFYIESLDNVENSAETQKYSYTVGALPVPWALYAAVGLGIAALVATAIYLWYRRRKRKSSASTAAGAAASSSKPPAKPVVTLYVPSGILAGYEEERSKSG